MFSTAEPVTDLSSTLADRVHKFVESEERRAEHCPIALFVSSVARRAGVGSRENLARASLAFLELA